ncbi:MAG TPA: hypothetical protein VHX60_04305 [Acidobacteriaceae bacterium]|jgi:hypothetical protein|nr:hypothetical protein [Acidobacteriaceae bacterium]
MHIARQTPQELVVVDSSRWVSALCAAGALMALRAASSHHKTAEWIAFALLVMFALIFFLRKTFIFDNTRRTVRWTGRTILKAESGEIAFDEINNIGTQETTATDRNFSVPVYRLAIETSRATVPMSYNYSGRGDRYSALRRQILEFVRPGSQSATPRLEGAAAEAEEARLRALLREGHRTEAIALARSTESLGAAEAAERVEAIEAGIRQEE